MVEDVVARNSRQWHYQGGEDDRPCQSEIAASAALEERRWPHPSHAQNIAAASYRVAGSIGRRAETEVVREPTDADAMAPAHPRMPNTGRAESALHAHRLPRERQPPS